MPAKMVIYYALFWDLHQRINLYNVMEVITFYRFVLDHYSRHCADNGAILVGNSVMIFSNFVDFIAIHLRNQS